MRSAIIFKRASILCIALILVALTACNKAQDQAVYANQNPADGNLAPADQYGSQESPWYGRQVQARVPPPALPDYSQPPCPGDNYVWTPGYWDYSNSDYYWVPGAWVMAPWVNALWTPPWWGYDDGVYILHAGYWGPHIGFYGGINYGYGYTGRGFYGAYWNHGILDYNLAVTNVNTSIVRNFYNYPVQNNWGNRISYNGGPGGINVRPSSQELAVSRDPRTPPVVEQTRQAREASSSGAQSASAGRPAALAIAGPLATSYRAPAARPPAIAMRAAARGAAPETRAPLQPNESQQQQIQRAPMRPVPEAAPPEPRNQTAAPPFTRGPQRGPVAAPQAQSPRESPRVVAPGPVPQTPIQREPQRAMGPRPAPQPGPGSQSPLMTRHAPQIQPATPHTMPPRPTPQPQLEAERTIPSPHPAPQPQAVPQRTMPPPHPAPQGQPEPPRAMQQQHPAPQAQQQPQRAMPMQRPAPQAPTEAQRAVPPHPTPQARPEPPHATPPAPPSKPAPPPKSEERKKP